MNWLTGRTPSQSMELNWMALIDIASVVFGLLYWMKCIFFVTTYRYALYDSTYPITDHHDKLNGKYVY